FADHPAERGFEDAKPVIAALKSKGVLKVGAAGFCWGANVVVELAKHACIDTAAGFRFHRLQARRTPRL
ncbi:dienelactone hydrolase family protein, partial [Salmonella sp. s57402]|uniref:dienelactone hydrolase family protein n=1 Tax=Salmonella sp. s57402 TaxID=3159695 RepID=UPI0039805B04